METMEQAKKKIRLNDPAVRWLWSASGGNKRFVAALLAIQVILGFASLGYSLLFRELIDRAVSKDLPGFYYSLAGLVGLVLFQLALVAVNRWLEEYTRSGIENMLKRRLFGTLLAKNYASVTARHSGEWLNRLTSDSVFIADGMTTILPNLCGMLVRMLGALTMIIVLEPLMGVLLVPAGVLAMVITIAFRPSLKRMHGDIQQSNGKVWSFLQERLDNLLIIRTFAQQGRTMELTDEKMADHRAARMRRNMVSNLCGTAFSGAMHGIYIIGAAVCCLGIIHGTVSFGTMTAVLQLIGRLQAPFSSTSNYVAQWYSMLSSAERFMEAEAFREDRAVPRLSDQEVRDFYQQGFTGIGIEGLRYSYVDTDAQTRSAIENINLEIQKNEFIAIVGHSGCGKSTLLKLLMCVYTPDDGKIILRGREPGCDRVLSAGDGNLFAYVPQGNQLMSGTIRDAIAFGDPQKARQDGALWYALEIACADDFVSQLPEGLDTLLGEHGCGLSEGQLQRLALARALFSQRPILLLDESTSALDEDTERRVLNNLKTMTDHTVLLVSHRPQACMMCDRIIELARSDIKE